jgi:hypothetical protein
MQFLIAYLELTALTVLLVILTYACQSARKTDPLSASKIDPPCDIEIRA